MRAFHRAAAGALGLLLLFLSPHRPGTANAEEDSPLAPPPAEPSRPDPGLHALVDATVHVAPGKILDKATIVLRGGSIVSVSDAEPPAGARVWNLKGLHVHAGFLDPWVEVEVPAVDPNAPARHWNQRVQPQRSALDGAGVDRKTAQALRELGFTAAGIVPRDGIFRGRGAVVSLARSEQGKHRIVTRRGVHALAFERSGWGGRDYPTSQMGCIALIRQTLYDADWIREKSGTPAATSALRPLAGREDTLAFRCADPLEVLRAGRIAAEFGRPALFIGSGLEFQRLDAIAALKRPLVVPLAFPERPEVTAVGAAEAVPLRDLMAWEQAPTNPRRLHDAGVVVALTTTGLKKRKDFPDRLRQAIRHGLEPKHALGMLTTVPARLLGVDEVLGTVEKGKRAHLVIRDKPPFARESGVLGLWIDGAYHEVAPRGDGTELVGTWTVTLNPPAPREIRLVVRDARKMHFLAGDAKAEVKTVRRKGNRLSLVFDHAPLGEKGMFTLSGVVGKDRITGHGIRASGVRFAWTAVRGTPGAVDSKNEDPAPPEVPVRLPVPFGAYGTFEMPVQPDVVVFRGGTVWTCANGILEDGEVEVRKGRISYVGDRRDSVPAGAVVVDATGKHLTPGLIDCHSHTGISKGINEGSQACTAEVRIQDVLNPDHVSWYRQLAGGITTVNSLHGSANPIGGQSQTHKNRWGVRDPYAMRLEGAQPGIKFALGENVKQSNWGDDFTTRYPQTRMGVESWIRDRFLAAREYAAARGKGERRRDLELDALAEILAGKRWIHCHSYRQDEILMLCRIAGEFGFKIGTFQHVLEGYKVAEAIRKHAVGGSAFSDWWAYKVEVQDAIPHNGALMHEVGVVVSFNSDSNEMARRMNVEAAKAVKYGGLSPEEALQFVTLNPARQLGIESLVGSLEEGKHADLALWSHSPLSTRSRCVATWIDGREYFSLQKDAAHRKWIQQERQRILQKLLRGERKPKRKKSEEDEEEAGKKLSPREQLAAAVRRRFFLERLAAGLDPLNGGPGDCGCAHMGGAR